MTNPTTQDREMAEKLFDDVLHKTSAYGEWGIENDRIAAVETLAQAITTARLQGRREGLEEAARMAWDLAVDYDKHWRAQVVAAIRTLYSAEPDKDGEG